MRAAKEAPAAPGKIRFFLKALVEKGRHFMFKSQRQFRCYLARPRPLTCLAPLLLHALSCFQVSIEMGDVDADFDKLLAEQAEVQNRIEALNCWSINHEVEIVMQARHHRHRHRHASCLKAKGGSETVFFLRTPRFFGFKRLRFGT